MAYTGSYRVGGASFNDQQVGEEFKKALQKSTPGFLGLKAGQFFTGEGGTQYKTVAGINPNEPGWGQLVDPEYRLIGYQGGARLTGRARGMGISDTPQGFAILQRIPQPKAEEPKPQVVETPPPQVLPPVEEPKPEEPKGPSMADIAAQFSAQIQEMQKGFMESMQAQSAQFQQMQAAQQERMTSLQQQMLQSQIQQQQRPEVAGVKMASGTSGTPMQIARRGVTGAFGRRGMRISSLNV